MTVAKGACAKYNRDTINNQTNVVGSNKYNLLNKTQSKMQIIHISNALNI